MITKFKYLLLFIMLFMFPCCVEAKCTIEDKSRLKELISNVNISYDYQIVGKNAVFSLKFNNVSSEIYFVDQWGNRYYGNDDFQNYEIVLNNYYDGQSYTFRFYGANVCISNMVGQLYATVPNYNYYYNLKVCDDAREFDLCQKWVSHDLTRNEFIDAVNEYKNRVVEKDDLKVNKKISVFDFVMNFLDLYGLYILIGVVLAIVIVKVIRYKKDTFGF